MLFYAAFLYMPLIVSGNILCGLYKPLERFGVCTCTTLDDRPPSQADCTKYSWLQQLPSFSMHILHHIRLIDMSGTVFCHTTSLKTTAYNKTVLCMDSTTGT
jgi:hypothetical protein